MKVNVSAFLIIMAQLVFSILFLFLFANNALLRPTAHGILYKEYFIGAFLLFFVYLNALVFYPRYYLRNRPVLYVLSSLACIAVALVVEFAWIYPDVMQEICQYMNRYDAQSYFWGCVPFVFLRDLGGFSVTFLLCEFIHLRHREKHLDKTLVEIPGIIIVENTKQNVVLLKIHNIMYCEQEGNYTKIYHYDKQIFFRYGSLSKILLLLGKERFIQINRNTIVQKNQIKAFSDGMLWLSGEEQPFELSPVICDQQIIQTLVAKNSRKQKEKRKNSDFDSEEHVKKNKEKIIQLIAEDPGISAVQLAKETGIPQRTIHRHIAPPQAAGSHPACGFQQDRRIRGGGRGDGVKKGTGKFLVVIRTTD